MKRKDDQYPAIPHRSSLGKNRLITEHQVQDQDITGSKLNDILDGLKRFTAGLLLSAKLTIDTITSGTTFLETPQGTRWTNGAGTTAYVSLRQGVSSAPSQPVFEVNQGNQANVYGLAIQNAGAGTTGWVYAPVAGGMMECGYLTYGMSIASTNWDLVLDSNSDAYSPSGTAAFLLRASGKSAKVAVKIQGSSGQSANLLECNVNGGAAVMSVSKDGDTGVRDINPSRNANITGDTNTTNLKATGYVNFDPSKVDGLIPPNGSFENIIDTGQMPINVDLVTGTYNTDVRIKTSDSMDGQYSLEFINTAVAAKARFKLFMVRGGVRYDLSWGIKKTGTPTQTADIAIEWYDRTQTIIGTADITGVVLSGLGSGWETRSMQKIAPATACYAKVYAAKHDATTFGFLVDGFKMTVQDRPLARCVRSTTQTITTATNTVFGFDTTQFDTHTAVTGTGTSWKWTCPAGKAGKYRFSTAIMFDFTGVAGNVTVEMSFAKNGTRYANFWRSSQNMNSDYLQANGSTLIDVAEGDYIQVVIYQASGSNKTNYGNADYNWFTAERVDPN